MVCLRLYFMPFSVWLIIIITSESCELLRRTPVTVFPYLGLVQYLGFSSACMLVGG